MIGEVAKRRLARRVEPASHACEVSAPGCVWQIVGHRPYAQQHRKQLGLRIRERVHNGPAERTGGWRRHSAVQHSGIEIKKRLKESCAIVQRRRCSFDQKNLKFHASVGQQP